MTYPCIMTKADNHHCDVVVLFTSARRGIIVHETTQPIGKPPHVGTAGRLGYTSSRWTEATNTRTWKPATLSMIADKSTLADFPELLL